MKLFATLIVVVALLTQLVPSSSGTLNDWNTGGSFGQMLEYDGSTATWYDGRGLINLWEEFLTMTISTAPPMGPLNLVAALTGTGSSATALAGPANAPGIVQLVTGSTTNGVAGYRCGTTAILLGGGHLLFEARVRIPVLSAPADLFNVYVGFGDNGNAGDMTDGAYIMYSSSSNNYTNVAKWSGKTANNTARTEVPSSLTVNAATFYVLAIDVNAAGNLVTFYVDGVSIGTSSANIPTATGRECGVLMKIEKLSGSTGTTSMGFDLDYAHFAQRTTR